MRVRDDERGVSAVEFALVFPLLIVLTVGMFYAGIALHRQLSLDHAARDGARHGATLVIDDENDGVDGYLDSIVERTKQAATGELNDTGADGRFICVAVRYRDNGDYVEQRRIEGDAPASLPSGDLCFDDDRPDNEQRVQVWIGRDTVFDAVFLRRTISLDTTALARYERHR